MYLVIGLLVITVAILSFMSATKPPVVGTETVVPEKTSHREREILFNVGPIEDHEDTAPDFDELFGDEEEEEDDPNITRLDLTMYAVSAVNLRAGHSTDFDRIGSLSANQEVHVIGQSNETGWYMIEYGDGVAFVSNGFLSDTPVEGD
jgi:uncharacterized protein YgiM (DUF1202 family)